jgi:hypothetical protein
MGNCDQQITRLQRDGRGITAWSTSCYGFEKLSTGHIILTTGNTLSVCYSLERQIMHISIISLCFLFSIPCSSPPHTLIFNLLNFS